ncbi:MAG TPA: CBS domain-containing protein [Candidatus Binatia bacterium]|nr:CBS domain-containing protein [Candidatus Binatia bacterium]
MEQLRHEHEVATRVLGALEEAAERAGRGEDATADLIVCLDFLTTFLGGVHERREEDGLFPVLAGHGLGPDRSPISVLRAEHERGRHLLWAIRATVERGGAPPLGAARAYAVQMRAHFARENAVLLPFAAQVLSAEDEEAVARAGAAIEGETGGAAALEALEGVAAALEGAARARGARSQTPEPSWCARDVMRAGVPAVGPGDSLARAIGLMESVGVRELPVVAEGRVVGIVTRRDLQPYVGHFEWTAVRTAMSHDPLTVAPEASVQAVARSLFEREYNALPVTDERGALLGMVSRRDLLRLLAGGRGPRRGGAP